jgi:hypothetical protein
VQNNIIGADMTGLAALGNAGGVALIAGAHHNFIGIDGDGIADDREGNLISGNSAYGVLFWQAGTENNVLAGNLIGTDATGLAAMPNTTGVSIYDGAARNLVGTNADGVSDDLERNIVSGNVNGISTHFVEPRRCRRTGPARADGQHHRWYESGGAQHHLRQ